jgi:hypothetical protein
MNKRMIDPVYSGLHADQLKWVGVYIWLSLKIGACLGVGAIAAIEQYLFENGRKFFERILSLWCDRRLYNPASVVHLMTIHLYKIIFNVES